ncbi:MAG: molybdopterin-guanine dinucleotide biosynthesis protein B [Candidatus Bathyarchaeota archaeon]
MFNKVILAVVGTSKSGKTTAIEVLIKGLTKKGYKIGSAKHIPEVGFTIDSQGKDTWRHTQAGASAVLSVSQKEVAIIRKINTENWDLKRMVSEFPEDIDLIILEGFKKLVEQDSSIPKLITAKTIEEVKSAFERYKNILSFIVLFPFPEIETDIPFIDTLKEPEKLVNLVDQKVAILIKRKREREEKIIVNINGEILPLGDFVQDILRNTILGMISSLKGVKIKGEEKVSVVIKD